MGWRRQPGIGDAILPPDAILLATGGAVNDLGLPLYACLFLAQQARFPDFPSHN
jgi:hypothetical protein